MRENMGLYRGKRKDNGEWVEGYYVYDESGQTTEKPTAYICHLNTHPCGYSLIPYEVDPETVGEYTGLHDINGRKIFEGDIVKLFLIDGIEIGVIKFNDLMCRFMFYDKSGGYSIDNTCDFEIIDNIHDSPELLQNT